MLEGLTYYHGLRYRLLPYIYTLAADTHFGDGTIMRALVMDFANDRSVWEIDDQFMMGPSLLVAPVTEFRARERTVYLPSGKWHDAASGAIIDGGKAITVATPRERIPLFVRAGAIVPTGPDVQWSGENPQGPLILHVFTGASGQFSLYEDQGSDLGYEHGRYSRIPIAWDEDRRHLIIGARKGNLPGNEATAPVNRRNSWRQRCSGFRATQRYGCRLHRFPPSR